ncbi:SAM-dependent methyltransferase [Paenibacillus hunanensis]|uniref:SAM-dependent methyltransferase n=1 Tax=Paenibacillus hunanensis TaxID=539262 RepID=UPI002A6A0281|nr:SAM-dependent methyltransferase [Paenibacillus hunanensis]WPP39700.1 SAM-dependent methyltransferase [Paenibacillus hunanensis]
MSKEEQMNETRINHELSNEQTGLELSRIVFIGRTFDEYLSMFDLTKQDLIGRRILDCPAGACSFTAVANTLGAQVTATDIAYYHPFAQLAEKGLADIEHTMLHMEKVQSNYVWDYFQSVADLKKHRSQALADCAHDMQQFPERYIAATLPRLPFEENAFDLTLSAHFLFMYSDRLDYEFHLQTVQELLRVTRQEIRIFPLVDLSCRRYQHLDQLIEYIENAGYQTEEVTVSYEFQKGANTMLRIYKD